MVDVTGPQKFVAISTLQSGQFDVALPTPLVGQVMVPLWLPKLSCSTPNPNWWKNMLPNRLKIGTDQMDNIAYT
jgi:uncharacterized ion transporter superfamily protein YfcC